MTRIRISHPDKVIFNGYDEICLSGLAAGADGAIGSTYNFMADKFLDIQAPFERGAIAVAQKIQREAVRIIDGLIRIGVMPGEKAVLDMMGFHMGRCRKPFRQVTAEEKEYLRTLLTENDVKL